MKCIVVKMNKRIMVNLIIIMMLLMCLVFLILRDNKVVIRIIMVKVGRLK